jgi:hypothetical protein
LSRAPCTAVFLIVGSDLPASGGLLPSFKSWFLITLDGGAACRASFDALAAAATADGLIGLGFAGCVAGTDLAVESAGGATVDCGSAGCEFIWPQAKAVISKHPAVAGQYRARIALMISPLGPVGRDFGSNGGRCTSGRDRKFVRLHYFRGNLIGLCN